MNSKALGLLGLCHCHSVFYFGAVVQAELESNGHILGCHLGSFLHHNGLCHGSFVMKNQCLSINLEDVKAHLADGLAL